MLTTFPGITKSVILLPKFEKAFRPIWVTVDEKLIFQKLLVTKSNAYGPTVVTPSGMVYIALW